MLGNAPDAFYCGEVYAWFRPYRAHHFSIKCTCKRDPCPYWENIKALPENRFHAKVLEQLKVDFVMDSSKDLPWVLDNNRWAAENGIDVINLLLYKNPVDLAYSHWKRGRGLVHWRKVFLRWYGRYFQSGLPYVSVRHADLARHAAEKLEQICCVIGMEYFPGKEKFWEKEHHHLFGSQGVRKRLEQTNSPRDRYATDLPAEFREKIPLIRSMLEQEPQILNLMEKLEEAEISHRGSQHGERTASCPRKSYPIWYYVAKMKRRFKRYFPEPWPYDQ